MPRKKMSLLVALMKSHFTSVHKSDMQQEKSGEVRVTSERWKRKKTSRNEAWPWGFTEQQRPLAVFLKSRCMSVINSPALDLVEVVSAPCNHAFAEILYL